MRLPTNPRRTNSNPTNSGLLNRSAVKRKNYSSKSRSPFLSAVALLSAAVLGLYLPPLHANHDPDLTIIGAERAGNDAGTIPPWQGGIRTPPVGYQIGDRHPDPFKDDQILFTIDQSNAAEFKELLSAGHKALLEKYPDTYKLPIYPSRRSTSHPQSVLDATIKYSGKARVVDNGAGVENIVRGVPFPHPANGEQAIWNARLSYKAGGYRGYYGNALTASNGSYQQGVWLQEVIYPYSDDRTTLENLNNIKLRGLFHTLRPARDAGSIFLYYRYINSKTQERRNWKYNPGKRRVKRSTMTAADQLLGSSDGIHMYDQGGMFRGPITNFNWTLIGKQELYVPYNAYQLHSGEQSADTIVTPHHINQDLTRYELHRVWVLEAFRKEGVAHRYKKRRYFLDEDTWKILLAEHYDDAGNISRFTESHNINYYEVPVFFTTLDTFYKLDTDRYFITHLDNAYPPFDFSFEKNDSYFMPGRLKMKAKR